MLRHGVADHQGEGNEKPKTAGKLGQRGSRPRRRNFEPDRWHQSSTGHVKPGVKQGGPPPKAKYYLLTDSEQYREGKVKRTPGGE